MAERKQDTRLGATGTSRYLDKATGETVEFTWTTTGILNQPTAEKPKPEPRDEFTPEPIE